MAEQQKFIEKLPVKYPIHFVEGAYEKERFYEMAKDLRTARRAVNAVSCVMN